MSDLNALLSRGNNLNSFNQPVNKPLPPKVAPQPPRIPPKPLERKPRVDSGFKLVDLRNGKVKDPSIYKSNFRDKTIKALDGTLRRYSDRQKVAKILWNARGGGGISAWEIKKGLRASGLQDHQIRAVRKKLGAL